jgi:hypothetical protein
VRPAGGGGGAGLPAKRSDYPLSGRGAPTAIMKTREERREELKRLAARPNGTDRLYLLLTRNFIPFEKLPIATLMIEAVLDHEYPEGE